MKRHVESISIRREDDAELGLFIYAVAELHFTQSGAVLVQELRSGGLAEVEGDEDHLEQVGKEQQDELVEMLGLLGLSDDGCPPPFATALSLFQVAAANLNAAWGSKSQVARYPDYLPSFDDFVADFAEVAPLGVGHLLAEAGEMSTSDGLGSDPQRDEDNQAMLDAGRRSDNELRFVKALGDIAEGVPREEEWASAAGFMEYVAGVLDQHGIARPQVYSPHFDVPR